MGRKKDHDYFAMLVEGVNYACEAATMLKTTFENFEPEKLQENINKVHHVEIMWSIRLIWLSMI